MTSESWTNARRTCRKDPPLRQKRSDLPHGALGNLAPLEFAAAQEAGEPAKLTLYLVQYWEQVITDFSLEMATLNQELLAWEHTYNTIRPHQALGYLTPLQFVTHWQRQQEESKCH